MTPLCHVISKMMWPINAENTFEKIYHVFSEASISQTSASDAWGQEGEKGNFQKSLAYLESGIK